MSDQILVEVQERVLTVRINRPEKKNALTQAMYASMIAAFRRAEADADVRVVFITGTDDCFTAGNDLADFANAPREGPSVAIQFLETLAAAQKPVVAAVSGVAIGIGTTMLLHCDLVYAGTNARFQLPFVNLGLCPEAASSVILPWRIGHARAAELLFFGEAFSAQSASELGLVNHVFADDTLPAVALAKAHTLAEQPPRALRTAKALLKQPQAGAIADAMARETKEFAALLQGPEAREALMAFMQKRKPDFSKF
jgi:enoyl-CoA hydratase/carnithine racemase